MKTAAGATPGLDKSSKVFRTSVTATLSVRNWARAMDFYKAAFGASEIYCVPGGGVAQLSVAGAEFWVAEESPEHLNFSPESLGGCSVRMLLMVEDPAVVCAQAIRAGQPKSCRSLTRIAGGSVGSLIRLGITGRLADRLTEKLD
jgi:PhnB protein